MLKRHTRTEANIESIPVKTEIKYLVQICLKVKLRKNKQTEDKIDFLLLLLSKAGGISEIIYPCQSLYVPPQMIKRINSVIFNFIQKNKTHYRNRSQIMKDSSNGGLKAPESESMIEVFQLNWKKDYLVQPGSIRFHV